MPRRRRKRKNISRRKPPVPPPPSYASIFGKTVDRPDIIDEKNGSDSEEELCEQLFYPDDGRNNSCEAWSNAYREYLSELREMFVYYMNSISGNTDYLKSDEFMDYFSQFVFDNSSGRISPYL